MTKTNWKFHFSEQARIGCSVVAYCRNNDLHPSQWYQQKKKLAPKKDKAIEKFSEVNIKPEIRRKELTLSIALSANGTFEFRGSTNNTEMLQMLLGKGSI